ncbi:ATP-dependent DNA helicase PIF1-like protein [Tanacetum coccineum]
MLLNVARVPQGFKELMTVNNRLYPTFKAACFAYGLLNDDKEWAHAISELWEQTWELLSEDILRRKRKLFKYPDLQLIDEQIKNYCLLEIETLLNRNGRSLTDFQELPRLNSEFLTHMDNRLIREALDFDIKKVRLNMSSCIWPGGTAKTFLYQTIISRLRSERMIVLAVASSASKGDYLGEAPMTQKYAFEVLNRTLRDILGYKNPEKRNSIFGGVTVLLGGDFRQILPVIPKGKRAEIVQVCINRSKLWKSCPKCGGRDYGREKKEDEDETTWIEILEYFIINAVKSPIEQIVKERFPDFTTKKSNTAYLKERAILTPKNDDADAINAYMFEKLPCPTVTYNNADEVCKASTDVLDQKHLYPAEKLNSLNFLGMPPHALNLKKELPIMLLRNVNPKT